MTRSSVWARPQAWVLTLRGSWTPWRVRVLPHGPGTHPGRKRSGHPVWRRTDVVCEPLPMGPGMLRRALVGLGLAAAAAMTTCSPPAAHSTPSTTFGSSSASCRPDRVAAERRAGLTIAVMELGWDRYEPAPGQFDQAYVNGVRRQIATCTQVGLQVVLSPGLQYPRAGSTNCPRGTTATKPGLRPPAERSTLCSAKLCAMRPQATSATSTATSV